MTRREKAKQDMTEQLESGKILPLVFRLTIPAVVAQLITFLYNMVDRMYVARIEGTGTDALAALGIVLSITLIIQAFANLIGLGGAPGAGIRLGGGQPRRGKPDFQYGICASCASGNRDRSGHLCVCQTDHPAVWLSRKRCGVCGSLP